MGLHSIDRRMLGALVAAVAFCASVLAVASAAEARSPVPRQSSGLERADAALRGDAGRAGPCRRLRRAVRSRRRQTRASGRPRDRIRLRRALRRLRRCRRADARQLSTRFVGRPRLPAEGSLFSAVGSLLPVGMPVPTPTPSPTPVNPGESLSRSLGVTAREFSLTLSRPLVGAGSVRVELVNGGEDPHDLAIEDDQGNQRGHLGPLAPSQFKAERFPLDPGSYQLFCTLQGHKAAGMTATLKVR